MKNGGSQNTRKATDARIGLMTEVLNSIRVIKFFGLEGAFFTKVREKREIELKYSITSRFYSLLFYCVTSLLPVINMASNSRDNVNIVLLISYSSLHLEFTRMW